MSEKKQITKAAGLMSSATFASRIMGFVRDMTMANFFGTSGVSDSFYLAFKIPNMLREIFAEGSMSAAVIPVLTGYQKDDPRAAKSLVRVLLGFVLIAVGVICILGILFAGPIVSVIGYGLSKDPEKASTLALTVVQVRTMMPFLLFISLASIIMAALNTRRVFFVPALSPALFNITIVISVFLLAGILDQPIMAAAIGVVIGGFMQFLIQTPSHLKMGGSLRPSFAFSHPGLKQIGVLILPVTFGMAVSQINIVVGAFLAAFLPAGSITYLFVSMRLIQFPIGVFGVAMGIAILPSLSSHAHEGNIDKLKEDFSFALRLLFFIGVPAMAGLIALRVPIIATLFQRGEFTVASTVGTSQALLYYALGIWATMGVKVLASTFYSLKDTKTPVKAAVAALTINIILSIMLMGPMLHSGLALAQSLSAILNFSLLFILLRRNLKGIGAGRIINTLLRSAFAALIMALAGAYAADLPIWLEAGRTLEKAGLLGALIAGSVIIYMTISALMKSDELSFVLKLIKDRYKRSKQ
jgi:putative peptidoglycan lipid II flippase